MLDAYGRNAGSDFGVARSRFLLQCLLIRAFRLVCASMVHLSSLAPRHRNLDPCCSSNASATCFGLNAIDTDTSVIRSMIESLFKILVVRYMPRMLLLLRS